MKMKTSLLLFFFQCINLSLFANLDEFNQGLKAFQAKNLNDAKQHFLNSTQDPEYTVKSFLALGQVALAQKDVKDAENFLRNAINANLHYGTGHSASDIHAHISTIYGKNGYPAKMAKHKKLARLLDESKK